MKRALRRFAGALGVLALAACSQIPFYTRPATEVPERYREDHDAGGAWRDARPGDQAPRGAWWEMFGDPVLDGLAAQVATDNQSLRQSYAKYTQAAALTQQARAGLFPTLTGNLGTTRGQNAIAGAARAPGPTTTDTVSMSASWEADLWGRLSGTLESNRASADAALADALAARLSLEAQLVQTYLALRIVDEQLDLLRRTVADYEKALELTRNRFTGGVAAKSDVTQAETQLHSTRAQAIDTGIARAQYEHAIAVLIGKLPAQFALPAAPFTARVPQVPLSAPSTLLERRPDVAAAERRIAAANAQIGSAKAARFPVLSISGSAGYRGAEWAGLLAVPNRFWSIAPAVALTIFDGSAKRAQVAQAVAQYDQNVASYRQTVLAAFQDVEDNLVALRVLAEEARVQAEAVRAAEESLMHAQNQYKAGTVSYLNVITAQTALYGNRRASLDIANRRFAASVGLNRALGGGYAPHDPGSAVNPAPAATETVNAK